MQTTNRRYDLDWLRIIAILAVFLFHGTRFFNDHTWHVSNFQTSPIAAAFVLLFSQWGMPFIFVVSGASIVFALHPGQARQFLLSRVLRLLLPLMLCGLLLSPPQIYLDRLTHLQFSGSFWDFLPHYFEGSFEGGTGNFSWLGIHLWYLAVLFFWTALLLPLFAVLKTSTGQRWLAWLGRISRWPGVILLWAVPIGLVMGVLDPNGLGERAYGGWSLFVYPFFLTYGYWLYASQDCGSAVIAHRWIALLGAVGLSVVVVVAAPQLPSVRFGSLQYLALMVLNALYAWCWIVATLGFGMRHLQRSHPLLAYANEAVLPFYVLHQPILLFVGYFVVRWPLPILAKFLIIVPLAFGLTLAVYDLGIRRLSVTRVIMGLKPRPAPASRSQPGLAASGRS